MKQRFFTWLFFTVQAYNLPAQTLKFYRADDSSAIFHLKISCTNTHTQIKRFSFTNESGEISVFSDTVNGSRVLVQADTSEFIFTSDTLAGLHNKTYYLKANPRTLSEVVITAQYAPGTVEKSVHRVNVIDRKKIDAMGAQNLRDVLTNELNIRLSQDNILGSSMSLQGISGQNVKILIDDVPVNGRLNGNIDLSQLNMLNVERIEIVEGPLSVKYGTDALAGTINIIMKKRTNGFSASSTSYYESAGQYNFSGQVGFTIKKTGILLSGARYYFDGWRNSDKPFTVERSRVADSMRYMDWKPKEQFMGTIVLSRNIKQLQASFTSDYFFEEIMNRGFPRAPYQETAFDDYYKTKRFNNSFRLYGKAGKKHYVNLVSGLNNYTRIKNTYFKDLATLEQNLTENQGDQDTSRFNNITTRFSISSANDSSMLNYETGFDLGYETGTGLRIKNQKQSIGDYAVFASVEYRPSEKVVFKPALRVIYNTAYSAPLVPSFNIKYTVHGGHTLRASYARGFRSPSLKELYFYFVDVNHNITGNQELEAEHSHNFTLHYTFRHRRKKTEYAFELGGFYNHIENLITLSLGSGNSYSYFNLDLYKSTAVNTTISFNRKQFQASTGFSYIGQYNQLSETTATPVFVYSPETKFNLQYRLVKARCTFSLFYKYTGILPLFASDENGNVSQMKTGAYSMADFSVMKSFFGEFVKMTAGAKNLFNVTNVAGTTAGGTHAGGDLITPIGMGRIYFIKLDLNITR